MSDEFSSPPCLPGGHWFPQDMENQPPQEQVVSLSRLVNEARLRLGTEADLDTVLADLRERSLDVSMGDVTRAWEAAG